MTTLVKRSSLVFTYKRLAESQTDYAIATIANFFRREKRFHSLGWNGVLEVRPNGDVIGAGHDYNTNMGDLGFRAFPCRELIVR